MLEPYGYKHISLDELRTRKRERMLLDECLQNEQNFVVDNTNTLPSERACYIAPARAAGYEVVGYFFRSRVSECMERNAQRTNAVPRAAVAAMSKRLCLPSLEEGYDRLYFVSLENGKFNISDWVCYWQLRHAGMDAQAATEQLRRMDVQARHQMLSNRGIDFNALPGWQKRGVCLTWQEDWRSGLNPVTGEKTRYSRRILKEEEDMETALALLDSLP